MHYGVYFSDNDILSDHWVISSNDIKVRIIFETIKFIFYLFIELIMFIFVLMKVLINSLKKGDQFKFNNTMYIVKQKYSEWRKNDDPFLLSICGHMFYHDELEVELIKS